MLLPKQLREEPAMATLGHLAPAVVLQCSQAFKLFSKEATQP